MADMNNCNTIDDDDAEEPLNCVFCGKEVASVEDAIAADWEAYFYVDPAAGLVPDSCCCSDCRRDHLDPVGEKYILKPGHSATIDGVRYTGK